MGGGASTAAKYKSGELSDEEAQKELAALSDDDKAKLRDILAGPTSEMVDTNTSNVNENKSKLYQLEATVMGNKAKLHAERANIEENRGLILSNYSKALGNRQMANHNTDAIFRNQMETLKLQLKETVDPVKKNDLESRVNKMRIDSLRHRAKVNASLGKANELMDQINASLSGVNEEIMQCNEEVVRFNEELRGLDFNCTEASPESNAERISANTASIAEVDEMSKENMQKHAKVQESVKSNRDTILSNAKVIEERRNKIEAARCEVAEQTTTIATLIAFC